MVLTIKDCVSIFATIENLQKTNLLIPLAWKLDDIKIELLKHVERWNVENLKLGEKFGTRETKDGNDFFNISGENLHEYKKEAEKILTIDVEVNIEKIPFNMLQNCSLNGTSDINVFKKIVEKV